MSTKCKICVKSVYPMDPQINLDGSVFHKSCAKCSDCKCQITLSNFTKTENTDGSVLLLCKTHYFKRFHEQGSYVGGDKFQVKNPRDLKSDSASPISSRQKEEIVAPGQQTIWAGVKLKKTPGSVTAGSETVLEASDPVPLSEKTSTPEEKSSNVESTTEPTPVIVATPEPAPIASVSDESDVADTTESTQVGAEPRDEVADTGDETATAQEDHPSSTEVADTGDEATTAQEDHPSSTVVDASIDAPAADVHSDEAPVQSSVESSD